MEAFKEALTEDDNASVSLNSSTSHLDLLESDTISDEVPTSKKPEKIISKNDWIPIHTKLRDDMHLKRRGKKAEENSGNKRRKHAVFQRAKNKRKTPRADIFSDSLSYKFLRWPILFFALWWISFLFSLYLIVRMIVALSEFFLTWRGSKKNLREALRKSKNYEEWIENAEKLDDYLGNTQWKNDPVFYYYDYKTLSKTIKNLKACTNEENIEKLLMILQNCVKSNFAGIENSVMYSQTYYGTKNLIETYKRQVVESLKFIINDTKLPVETKYKFFKIINKNFGRSALCLSGGACFAYTHFGIIKAFVENDLLPSIISGTSGGGLVAALACTRTNEELKKLLIPELAYKITACEDNVFTWLPRWWKTGARFDAIDWASKSLWFTLGSLTFKEAFERTGKILNISTVPSDPYSPVILCNHITSPDCVIWSSLLASSAVPGILNPVVLMMKDKSGEVTPFSFGNKWKDGSLRTDIPVEALNTYFNVNFLIVSQVNPHISFFFFASKGSVGRPVSRRKGKGLRGGFLGSAIEGFLKLEIKKWLKFLKGLALVPRLLDQDWSNVWLQRFSGTITLWPKMSFSDFWYILSDPTPERLDGMIKKGEMVAYPKLLFIKNRLDIERVISKGLLEFKEAYFKTLTPDLRKIEAEEISQHRFTNDLYKKQIVNGIDLAVKGGSEDTSYNSEEDPNYNSDEDPDYNPDDSYDDDDDDEDDDDDDDDDHDDEDYGDEGYKGYEEDTSSDLEVNDEHFTTPRSGSFH